MSKTLFFILLLVCYQAKGNCSENVTLDLIKDDIDAQQKLEWEDVSNVLEQGILQNDSTAYFLSGYILYLGVYKQNPDYKKAKIMISISSDLGNVRAKHILGSFLITSEKVENVYKGTKLLESSFEEGILDSSVNLYYAYQLGKYGDIVFLKNSLRKASDVGDDEAAILLGQLALDEAIRKNDSESLAKMVSYLSNRAEKHGFSNDMYKNLYYLFFEIYGLRDSPLKNSIYGDYYLKKAAENGHEHAIKILNEGKS